MSLRLGRRDEIKMREGAARSPPAFRADEGIPRLSLPTIVSSKRRAPSGALALADLAGGRIKRASSLILPPPLRDYLHIEQAQMLLVPSI